MTKEELLRLYGFTDATEDVHAQFLGFHFGVVITHRDLLQCPTSKELSEVIQNKMTVMLQSFVDKVAEVRKLDPFAKKECSAHPIKDKVEEYYRGLGKPIQTRCLLMASDVYSKLCSELVALNRLGPSHSSLDRDTVILWIDDLPVYIYWLDILEPGFISASTNGVKIL